MPKVSVIIPNYNHAPYLQRRIDSVLAQTYIDFELILLDDCSTDNSAGLLLSYQHHPRVSQVLINDKNTGSPFEQWNKGFQLAKGEFIWIAESDDWCEPTLLETLVEPLLKNDEIVLSYCQSLVVALNGEITYKTQYPALSDLLDGNNFVTRYMFGDSTIINSGMAVFSKKVLAQIDLSYKDFKSAGDWMFWVQIASKGKVFISGKYLNYFTRHIKTVSSTAEVTGQDMLEGCRIFKWIEMNIHTASEERQNALKLRLALFFEQEKKYADISVRNNALKEIFLLSSKVKYMYWRKQVKKKLFSLIKKR